MEKHYVGIDLHRRRSVIVRRDDTASRVRPSASTTATRRHPFRARRGRTRTRGRRRGDQRLVLARRPPPGERRERPPRTPPRQQLGQSPGEERRARRHRPRRPVAPRPPRRGLRRAARAARAARARPVPPQARRLPHLRQRADPRSAREEGCGGADERPVRRCRHEAPRPVELERGFSIRVESLRDLLEFLDREIEMLDRTIHVELRHDPRYGVLQRLPGIGPVTAAILIAEIGDIDRFPSPEKLCSWAGLTPRHRESDLTVHRGSITKQGSRFVRWVMVEAVQAAGPQRTPRRGKRTHRRATRAAHRDRRRGAATAHPRLLRAPRRRAPLSWRSGMTPAGPGRARARCRSWSPWADRASD